YFINLFYKSTFKTHLKNPLLKPNDYPVYTPGNSYRLIPPSVPFIPLPDSNAARRLTLPGPFA
ncbi:hypothetical protein, partial [Enterocloster bolteae]|uniref:hypothetical protein n=1 Tax=Enterocloster bolteae TaxID=208479 RepID=UPI002A837B86